MATESKEQPLDKAMATAVAEGDMDRLLVALQLNEAAETEKVQRVTSERVSYCMLRPKGYRMLQEDTGCYSRNIMCGTR